MREPAWPSRTLTVWLLIAAALAVIAPFGPRGTACGHDLTFHLHSWMEAAQQWREGILFPRWAANANYGSGEPRFIFYPPLSWILGGLLGTILQLLHLPAAWMFAPAAFIFCCVVLSGMAMHAFAREWLDEPDATLAALAYALNPYALVTIYIRSAYAELLAAAFIPLIFLWIVRDRPARRMLIPLALTMAGVWLTNVPAAIITIYTGVLLLVLMIVLRRNSRVALYGFGAIALGLGLAAFYIVPVLYEKRWIDVSNALSPGVRPFENFLFAHNGDPEHDRFLHTLSWLASGEIAVTLIAMVVANRWRTTRPRLWWALVATSAVAFVLMLPFSNFVYRVLPDLRFLQFPWRWMLTVAVAYAIFLIAALGKFRGKVWVCGVAFLALVGAANYALQPPCWPEDTPFMISEVYHTGFGYKGNDEYVIPDADNDEIKPDFPEYVSRGAEAGSPAPDVRVSDLDWQPYRKQLTVESPEPAQIVLRLMNYPAWQATVNGVRVVTQSEAPTGRMVVSLPAGRSVIDVRFVHTRDRWLGDGISLVSLLVIGGFWYVEKRRRP